MDKGLDIAERRCVLAFHASCSDSPAKLARLVERVEALRASRVSPGGFEQQVTALARSLDCTLDRTAAERALAWADRPDRHLVTLFDPEFPPLLREIAHPPVVLFVEGDPATLARDQIAIVGSRKASHYGRECAFTIGSGLAEAGIVVTSGMALGIDAAAHRGALALERATVAVYGCGIDQVYPRRHRPLAEAIARSGAVVSEFPLGAPPRPYHFPRRNRIISGLALGTVVVEAAARSGSMTTALHALEQSRDVFALPGSVRNPLAAGCHDLIRQGAMLIDSAADILAQYPQLGLHPGPAVPGDAQAYGGGAAPSPSERKVLEACAFDGANFDDIVRRAGLTATEVSSILSALEVRGVIRSLAGNTYVKTVE